MGTTCLFNARRPFRHDNPSGIPKTGGLALYVHCQTTLLSEFQSLFPDKFKYEGNRAIHFTPGQPLPFEKLRLLIKNALTYHLK